MNLFMTLSYEKHFSFTMETTKYCTNSHKKSQTVFQKTADLSLFFRFAASFQTYYLQYDFLMIFRKQTSCQFFFVSIKLLNIAYELFPIFGDNWKGRGVFELFYKFSGENQYITGNCYL